VSRGERAPVESIVELARQLVRVPTRAGVDSCEAAFRLLGDWFVARSIPVELLRQPDTGTGIGLTAEVPGSRPGTVYLLNATVDTAPFGDVATWSDPPTSGDVRQGWLLGRGSADSKTGVAVFCHLLAAAKEDGTKPAAGLGVLFDAGEHTGGFDGVRAYFADRGRRDRVAGVMIGYPGNDEIVVGSRGFLRAVVRVAGTGAHSGSRRPVEANAVTRAARLTSKIAAVDVGDLTSPEFPLPPKVTVTFIRGGDGFSVVPDLCEVGIDVRLTPRFEAGDAEALLRELVADLDATTAAPRPTTIELQAGWPSYRLPATSPLARSLQVAAAGVLKRPCPLAVVGPSNIGNFLAGLGIEATAGFGVSYRNLHAADEAVEVASIGPVYETYRHALRLLVDPSGQAGG
jgi:succinyl-diaminopimelate desuccinylase